MFSVLVWVDKEPEEGVELGLRHDYDIFAMFIIMYASVTDDVYMCDTIGYTWYTYSILKLHRMAGSDVLYIDVRWPCPLAVSVGYVRWPYPLAVSVGYVRWRWPLLISVAMSVDFMPCPT